MQITDPIFLFYFFPIFISFYYSIFRYIKLSNLFIIISSVYFYSTFGIEQIFILIFPLVVDYWLGTLIYRNKNRTKQKILLALGISINVGLLFYFKYANFSFAVLDQIFPLHTLLKPFNNIVVPLGISFITFQRISYIFDIYRKKIKPAESFLQYGTYATLFPHLISGPIVRFSEVKSQLSKRKIDFISIFQATKFLLIGFSFKVMVADQLLVIENSITNEKVLNSTVALITILSFSMRLYFDFLGYTFMALGLAKFIGFDFPQNFNSPYQAKNITDFWRRWNMTLSRWIKDYLYIPLGGSRKGKMRTYMNLVIVMLLVGLWHGASWNFVIWGVIHGIFLSLERALANLHVKLEIPNFFRILYTFSLVSFTWIFFKFNNMNDIARLIRSLFSFDFTLPSSEFQAILATRAVIVTFAFFYSFKLSEKFIERLKPKIITITLLFILFATAFILSLTTHENTFIYYNF